MADTFGLAGADPRVVFTMLSGSYYGDWDSLNNFLRAGLATPTYTLAMFAYLPFLVFSPHGAGRDDRF